MIVSIFYNQESWHELMTMLIKPFIEREQSSFKHWSIYLSTNRGEHITILIEPKKSSNKTHEERFLAQAELFLTESPSAIKVIEYPLTSVFQDFASNSIELNVDNLLVNSTGDDRLILAKQQLSEIIIDVLADQEIDIESIFTFLIYLQLGIIKAGFTNTKRARVNTLKLLLFLNTQENNSGDLDAPTIQENQQFVELFEYNKNTFVEIVEDIWNKDKYDDDLEWMKKWESISTSFLNETDFHQVFISLSKIAYDHLGLNGSKIQNSSSKQVLKIFNQVTKNMDKVIRIA
ncbi:MAG: hypothetical protein JWN56_996 [Sphingobacteriales bacterium]|nr:hypothetical protein [Sphingobacteriales bacterium]